MSNSVEQQLELTTQDHELKLIARSRKDYYNRLYEIADKRTKYSPTWRSSQPAPSPISKNLTASNKRSSAKQYLKNVSGCRNEALVRQITNVIRKNLNWHIHMQIRHQSQCFL